MALISKIRNNSWLLVVLIGLGLFSFILMDMMSGQQSVFGSGQNFVGKVGSDKIDQTEFSRTESIMRQFLYGNSNIDPYALKDVVWNYLTESKVVKNEAEGLGLGVSRDELIELQFGNNLSPVISQRFTNQQTRQVDRNQLGQIRQQIEDNSMEPNFKVFWAHQEREVIKQRLQDKIANMAGKAVYTPSWMVEMMNQDLNGTMNLSYVKVPYADIDNTEVSLSDEDFKSYYNENSYKYRQDEETRKVDFITFDVIATAADSAGIRKALSDKIATFKGFQSTKDDSLFVVQSLGTVNPGYFSETELGTSVGNQIISSAVGDVVGPYLQGNEYRLTKIQDVIEMADSADTRHILISAAAPEDFAKAHIRIDSFKTAIQNGSSKFADLATKFSQDPGSKDKGGKYESITPNSFVPEYNKILFITGEIGKLYTVQTSYGVHLVEVLSRNKNTTIRVKTATVGEPIMPSEQTVKAVENEVYKIVGANKDINSLKQAIAEKADVNVQTSSALKENDYVISGLGAGQSSRDIIRWAFGNDPSIGNPDIGEACQKFYPYQDPQLYYNNKYVIAALNSIIPAGLPSWSDMRTEIEPYVINRKKAEILKGKMNSQDLNALASANDTEVETANNVRFSGSAAGGLANETDVIAKAFSLDANGVSAPIAGNSGVFVVKAISKNPAPAPNATAVKRSSETNYKGRISSGLVQALRKNAGMTDNRATFF